MAGERGCINHNFIVNTCDSGDLRCPNCVFVLQRSASRDPGMDIILASFDNIAGRFEDILTDFLSEVVHMVFVT
jgi:hypothetical protein